LPGADADECQMLMAVSVAAHPARLPRHPGHTSPMDSAALIRAAAANHRSWFRRLARARGGGVERVGALDLIVGGGSATLAFPRSHRIDAAVTRIRDLGMREASCWTATPDRDLGTRLIGRGFGWGWRPHWMALDLARVPEPDRDHVVSVGHREIPDDVPYGGDPDAPPAVHVSIAVDGRTAGHALMNPWRGVAGIYSMGVSPAHRRKGIGRALTIAACRIAADRGCTHATLNATGEGELLYRAVGFQSLGRGQTWWLAPGPAPTPRQTALAEAIGFADRSALAALDPSPAELAETLPGGTSPLRLAVVTDRIESARWMLDRAPSLVRRRFEPFGGTLLHLAVEWDRPDFARLALDRGADPSARDRTYRGTPLDWVEHTGAAAAGAVLAAWSR
jgi:ribosomal protein S18 acetylase RimI-like enzyme